MASDTDLLIDRRRLKRRVVAWRLFAVVAAVVLVAVVAGQYSGGRIASGPFASFGFQRHVALLRVDGLIFTDPYREQAIYDLVDNSGAEAVIVRIDSPGGGTFASESLYRALRKVAELKPMVAVMDGVAASGGYMTAIAADHIVARESTVTGSIGVIMEATNFVGLMEMLGIENEAIRSGPLKARPNPLERMTPEGRAASQQIIDEVHEMFVGMVAERRGLDFATAARLADGRVYTGATAATNGLIDELGGEQEARRWLEETHGISADLPLLDVEIQYPIDLFDEFVSVVFGKSYLPERLTLDGLVSVWHPLLSVSD